MKKFLATLVLGLAMVLMPIKKSEAVVGLVIGNPTVSVVGGVLMGGSYLYMSTSGCSEMGCLGVGILGLAGIAVGLIVLDAKDEADVTFGPVAMDSEVHRRNFKIEEIETYNSELEELNAVRETITKEVEEDPNANVPALWNAYGAALSPETLKVADFNGKLLLRALK